MKRRIFTVFITCLLATSALLAQEVKREFEKSITRDEVPAKALEIAAPMIEDADNLRYFYEQNTGGEFYEIKLLRENRYFSIEFYQDGRLMDIEELVPLGDIREEARELIQSYFEENFRRYRLTRIQIQYSDDLPDRVVRGVMNKNTDDLRIRYEIEAIVKGGEEDLFGPYEFLFDEKGELLNSREIEERATDNVRY